MSHVVYLSLGTNLGDRLANLAAARQALSGVFTISAVSSIYETEPWGYAAQPAFLNQVIIGSTKLPPDELLSCLKGLEVSLGRQPTFRYGPRLIDIDILFFDDMVYNSPDLIIPHPRLTSRAFVLVPLLELAPDLVHPLLHLTIRQLASQVDISGVHRLEDAAPDTGGA